MVADVKINNPPSDGISKVKFSPTVPNLLLVSSWDKKVRMYDTLTNSLLFSYAHSAPVLDCLLDSDGKCWSAGIDTRILQYCITNFPLHIVDVVFRVDVQSGVQVEIAKHEQPVKSLVQYQHHKGIVVSGGWDSMLKVIDTKSGNPIVKEVKVPSKVYSMSCSQEILAVAMSDRLIHLFDIRNMKEPYQKRESSLKFQTRCIELFPSADGYAISSIEGRVAVEYIDPSPEIQEKKFAFKCHRVNIDGTDHIYPVHALSFHPGYGTFASGGGDGVVNIWDGYNKKRLRQYPKYPTCISSLCFNADGSHLAIASSYTFEQGELNTDDILLQDEIYVKSISDIEQVFMESGASDSGICGGSGIAMESDGESLRHEIINVEGIGKVSTYHNITKSPPEDKKKEKRTLVVFHHGCGYTGMSFYSTCKSLLKLNKYDIIAYDCRMHGQTQSETGDDLSLSTLSSDLWKIVDTIQHDNNQYNNQDMVEYVLVGHSMGGAVVVESSLSSSSLSSLSPIDNITKRKIAGIVVVDVVEGTATESLTQMTKILQSRPSSFQSIQEAIRYVTCPSSVGSIRNVSSALVSVPTQLRQNPETSKWEWITDLSLTKPYWKGGKLLVVASTDRLDKTLTIGQIQGKFQMSILSNVGHVIHEDKPVEFANLLHEFIQRNSSVAMDKLLSRIKSKQMNK